MTRPARRRPKRGLGRRVIRRRERLMALLNQDQWYTVAELAALLHVSKDTIRRDLREIEIPNDPCARRLWLRRRQVVRYEVCGAVCEL